MGLMDQNWSRVLKGFRWTEEDNFIKRVMTSINGHGGRPRESSIQIEMVLDDSI
jgi:hypothetical protein